MNLNLPTLHPKQQEIVESPAIRKLICCGRRFGKTTTAAYMSTLALLEGKIVLYACPRIQQTDFFWSACRDYLYELLENHPIIEKNETRRELFYHPSCGMITAKTAWSPDALRGGGVDLLLLDEFAFQDEAVWSQVGNPMLVDRNGTAVFFSTPIRKNHFFRLYNEGMADDSGRWKVWHATSFDNPYLSEDALREVTRDMNARDFQQEVLAEFLSSEGFVFRNVGKLATLQESDTKQHEGHTITFGIDWGQVQDYTVVIVFCQDCHQMLYMYRARGKDYPFLMDVIEKLNKQWRPNSILAEENSMGLPIIQSLRQRGVSVNGFKTTAQSKTELIRELALAFEVEEIRILKENNLIDELQAYEEHVRDNSYTVYSAPLNMHDDCVIALALAYRAAKRGGGTPIAFVGDEGEIIVYG